MAGEGNLRSTHFTPVCSAQKDTGRAADERSGKKEMGAGHRIGGRLPETDVASLTPQPEPPLPQQVPERPSSEPPFSWQVWSRLRLWSWIFCARDKRYGGGVFELC